MTGANSSQEVEVTLRAAVTRLVPCAEHAQDPPGEQTERRNPNGYDHDCPACAATPKIIEHLERTVTRHAI